MDLVLGIINAKDRVLIDFLDRFIDGGPSEHGFDPRQKLMFTNGLDQIIISSAAQTLDVLGLVTEGSEHNHRHLGNLPDPLQQSPAVHKRHLHVEQVGL